MGIDIFTVLITISAVILLLGLQLVFFWSQDRRSSWLGWWAALYLGGGIGTACSIFRDVAPDIGIAAANVAIIAAFGCGWQGTRAFERRKPRLELVIAGVVGWMLLCNWPYFMTTLPLRVVVSSIIICGFCLLAAYELWRGRAERLPSRMMAMTCLVSLGLIMALRIPMLNLLHFPLGGRIPEATSVGVFNLIILAHASSVVLLMISMSKERLELEQRGYALSDPLTGLLNRRAFQEQSKSIVRCTEFGTEPVSILVLDLDNFKAINDRFGHAAGDRVLLNFAEVAKSSVRPTDFVYRMGGEEFCCLLPDATQEQALQVAERIRQGFEASVVDGRGTQIRSTVSIGVASSDQMGHDLDAMYGSADAAAYAAKASGRNRSVVASSAMGLSPLGEAAGVGKVRRKTRQNDT
jgi:diguanylate cyclase (GGDEF)-like protein